MLLPYTQEKSELKLFILFMSMHACLEVVWDVWFLMV